MRVIRGSEANPTEMEVSLPALLGMLAVPGAFLTLSLFGKYSSLVRYIRRQVEPDIFVVSIQDKYFLIVFSMVITGVVTVLKWDRILPNRQDFTNLAPLPISSRMLFLANALAVLLLVALFTVDVNAASMLLFPAIVTTEHADAFFSFLTVHALCVSLASVFVFSAGFAVMGLTMALLPRPWFLIASRIVRSVLLIALLALLLTSFAAPALVRQLSVDPQSPLRWMPSLWFLALYQQWQHRPLSPDGVIASWAWISTLGSLVIGAASYWLGYRRNFVEITEVPARSPSARARRRLIFSPILNTIFGATGFQRATASFTLCALFRSESHALALSGCVGMGLVLSVQTLVNGGVLSAEGRLSPHNVALPAAEVAVPLTLIYFLALGVRFVMEMPAELSANWIFRATLDQLDHALEPALRKLIRLLSSLFVILPATLVTVVHRDLATAAGEMLVLVLATELLVRVAFFGVRKIPFTCARGPFQSRAVMLAFFCFLGYWIFTSGGSAYAEWMMEVPWRLLSLVPWAVAVGLTERALRQQRDPQEMALLFEDRADPAVLELRLDE